MSLIYTPQQLRIISTKDDIIEDLIIEKQGSALDNSAEANILEYIQSFTNDVTCFDDVGDTTNGWT